jgi:hypothetical protein
MKKMLQLTLLLTLATMLPQSRAATYTNYLHDASNAIAQAYSLTGDNPRVHRALGRALAAFARPSTSVAGDYSIFLSVATALLPLTGTPGTELISQTVSNAFTNFVVEAQFEILVLSNRIAAITPFQPLRRSASNLVASAQVALNRIFTTDNVQIGILSVRFAYLKIAAAARLTQTAEARQGLAPDSLAGLSVIHQQGSESGTNNFINATDFTETNPEGGEPVNGIYEYRRTGLNTARLVLHYTEGESTTVMLVFVAAGSGRFTYRNEHDGHVERGAGKFTVTD